MTILRTWDHVQEKNRPVDTGERTEHGHRIIHNPGTRDTCVEYPFNSLQLISTEIYDRRVKMGVQEAAEDLLAALSGLVAHWDEMGLHGDLDGKFAAARAAIAKAMGLEQ